MPYGIAGVGGNQPQTGTSLLLPAGMIYLGADSLVRLF